MKRKALVSLSAILPVAALAVGTALAHPPSATATNATALPSTPAKAVAMNSDARSFVIIIVISAQQALTGIKSADPAATAKQLDT